MLPDDSDNKFESQEQMDTALIEYLDELKQLHNDLIKATPPNEIPHTISDIEYLNTLNLQPLIQDLYDLSKEVIVDFHNHISSNKDSKYTDNTKLHILSNKICSNTFDFYSMVNFGDMRSDKSLQTNTVLRVKLFFIAMRYFHIDYAKHLANIPENTNLIPFLRLCVDSDIKALSRPDKIAEVKRVAKSLGLETVQIKNLLYVLMQYFKGLQNISWSTTQYFQDLLPNLFVGIQQIFETTYKLYPED